MKKMELRKLETIEGGLTDCQNSLIALGISAAGLVVSIATLGTGAIAAGWVAGFAISELGVAWGGKDVIHDC